MSRRGGSLNTGKKAKYKKRFLHLYGPCCPTCGRAYDEELNPPTIAHIIGVAEGGSNHPSNLRLLCAACQRQGIDLPAEIREGSR